MSIPRRLLYIEDHRDSKLLVSRLLEVEGTRVILCSDGVRGMELAIAEEPDFVLVDLNLPFMDGYETATRLKAIFLRQGMSRVPVVATSVYALHDEREMAMAAGCDGFIPKPVDVDTFVDTICRYYAGARDSVSPEREKAALVQYHRRLVEKLEARTGHVLLDENTNLYNARYLTTRLEEESSRSLRLAQPFVLLVVGVEMILNEGSDTFNTRGRAYRIISEIIRANIRASDVGHKMDGDSLCIILGNCTAEEGPRVGRRVSHHILEGLPNIYGPGVQVALSVGVNAYASGPMMVADFIRIAYEDLCPVH